MQKVYLLLRHNRQQGPYSLAELLQLPLLPTDLVWVEGKSAAWRYPSEIAELQSHFTSDSSYDKPAEKSGNNFKTEADKNKQKGKTIFVSLPAQQKHQVTNPPAPATDALEQKAEALRQRVLAHPSASSHKAIPDAGPAEESKVNWPLYSQPVDRSSYALGSQKGKKAFSISRQSLIAAAVLIVLIGGTWWLMADKNDTPDVVLQQAPTVIPDMQQISEVDSGDNKIAGSDIQPLEENKSGEKKKKNITPVVEAVKPNIAAANKTDEIVWDQESNNNSSDSGSEQNTLETAAEPEQKKKTIGQAIGGFFEKLKGKGEEEAKAPAQAGERRTRKRTDAPDAIAETTDITEQVKVSANTPATNWMLGVKGLKVTLHNQSKWPLQNAVVQIQYFNEEETLIDEKKIEFCNIKAGQKMTLPAPEHRLASFTRQQVISATGKMEE